MNMSVDEIDAVGWSYFKAVKNEFALNAVWEVISGTSVTIGSNTIDVDNSLVSSFFNAIDVGISKVKTTVSLSDNRVLVGVVTVNVGQC
jgi:hypothetical protein